jgi:2-hydroxymuconate-semialdehyde hydrolase
VSEISSSDIAVGEYSFRVNQSGTPGNEAILWLHGSGPGATALSNWELALLAFGDRYHCIAPDIIGFGDSTHPVDPPRGMRAFGDLRVETLLGLLDTLGLDRVHLVGNSMGGMLSMLMTLAAPERFDRIVMMGSGGAPVPPTPDLIKMVSFYDDPSVEAMEELLTRFVYEPATFGDELRKIAEARLPRVTRADVRRSHLATFDFAAGPPIGFTPEELATIEQNVLIVHGRDDRIIPVAASYWFLEHLPHAELHVFGQCGHWTQIEQPDRFHATLAAFLHLNLVSRSTP